MREGDYQNSRDWWSIFGVLGIGPQVFASIQIIVASMSS